MEQQIIADGGLQYIPQIAVQYVYLDFDGELTSYNGEILSVDDVEVKDSSLTEERIADIVAELNAKYVSQNVIFVTKRPSIVEYSTIYIGKTSAFDQYGSFAGLAETIDHGNQIRNDNAFVMLDSTASNEQIISTISHETDHLLGTLDHGGEGIAAYAATDVFASGTTRTNVIMLDSDAVTLQNKATVSGLQMYGGVLYIQSGGILIKPYIAGGRVQASGGFLESATLTDGSFKGYIENAAHTYIDKGIDIQVQGYFSNTTIDGHMLFYGDGCMTSTTVRGSLELSGHADGIYIDSGYLRVCNYGNATNVIWTPCEGEVWVDDGGKISYTSEYSGVYFGSGNELLSHSPLMEDKIVSGSMYIMNNGSANCTVVTGTGGMMIQSGGVATNTKLSPHSWMYVYSAGKADNVDIYSSAVLHVQSNGIVKNTRINSKGEILVFSGGIADNVTVSSGGTLAIHSGGTATNVCWTPCIGNTAVAQGAIVTYTSTYSGVYYGADNQLLSHSPTLNNKTVESGRIYVMSNGTATGNDIDSGVMNISDGGYAENNYIRYDGYIVVENGGIAKNNKIFGGDIDIYSGGVASGTCLAYNADMEVYNGGKVTDTEIVRGRMRISHGGFASNVVISSGKIEVYNSGTASNTIVHSGGSLYVSSGSVFGVELYSGGSVNIMSGGVLGGYLNLEAGAEVYIYAGRLDFTVAGRTENDSFLIKDLKQIRGGSSFSITVSSNQKAGTYKLAKNAMGFDDTVYVKNEDCYIGDLTPGGDGFDYKNYSYKLKEEYGNLLLTITTLPQVLSGDKNGLEFTIVQGNNFKVEYSTNNFNTALRIETAERSVDSYGLPFGTYQWRVKGDGEFVNGENIVSNNSATPQNFVSDADGNMDVFFSNANGTWGAGYAAEHQGFRNGWTGTREQVMLYGKNKIADVFSGSEDANILVLTDDANGDALFVEDIYTSFGKDAARISQIDEIRAGAGDDIIDMTSQKFAYSGDEMTIRGGLGDDVIWATGGDNDLFGDAGDDRIIGSEGFDLIVGGAGNDTMHTGGGGHDIFAFGENWGVDTVQLTDSDSYIALWFASGSESNWDAVNRIYRDGSNSVTVIGGENCNIDLKFGDEGGQYADMISVGAFESAASEKIFEDQNSGMLA